MKSNTLMAIPTQFENFITRRNSDILGFDRFFDTLLSDTPLNPSNYPPYNLEKTGDNNYRVEVAVAGYSKEELTVTTDNGYLFVNGKRLESDDNKKYLYKGIASRSFVLKLALADFLEVLGADLENGILKIDIEKRIPEELMPKTVEIK